jgi:hypothetical protein
MILNDRKSAFLNQAPKFPVAHGKIRSRLFRADEAALKCR